MDPQTIARLLSFVPPVAVVVWFLHAGKLEGISQARKLQDLQDYARSRDLKLGANPRLTSFSLTGAFEGSALSIDTPTVPGGKSKKTVTRVRIQPGAGSDTYRGLAPSGTRFLLVRRNVSVTLEALAGLSEVPSGDPSFDSEFLGYAPPGSMAPWSRPAFREGVLGLSQRASWHVDRIERSPEECTVVLGTPVLEPAALERAIQLAGTLIDATLASRLEPSLAQPLRWEDPPDVRRADWHWSPLGLGFGGGFILMFMGPFMNPAVRALVGFVACDEGSTIAVVTHGKSSNLVCRAANGASEGANLWGMLVSFGLHFFVIAAIVIVVRSLRRPRS